MGYKLAMESAGATVSRFTEYGSYQGDWLAEVSWDGKHGYIHGSYGSCSGCDAYQAECDSLGHYDESGEVYHSVTWGDVVENCAQCEADKKKIAEFGKKYLKSIKTKEEMIKDLEEGASWTYDKAELIEKLRFVDADWVEPEGFGDDDD